MTELEFRKRVAKVFEFPGEGDIPCEVIGHENNVWSPMYKVYFSKAHAIKALIREFFETESKMSREFYNSFEKYFSELFAVFSVEDLIRHRAKAKKDKLEFVNDQIVYIEDPYSGSTGIKMMQPRNRTRAEFINLITGQLTEETRYLLFKYWFFNDLVVQCDGYFCVADVDWRVINQQMPELVGRLISEVKAFDEQVRCIEEEVKHSLTGLSYNERKKVVQIWKDRLGNAAIEIMD